MTTKFIDKLAIAAMCMGAVAALMLIFSMGKSYDETRKQQEHQEVCEEAAVIMATTALCLKDKDFKCFVTPKDYREFAGAIKKHKDNQCEVK